MSPPNWGWGAGNWLTVDGGGCAGRAELALNFDTRSERAAGQADGKCCCHVKCKRLLCGHGTLLPLQRRYTISITLLPIGWLLFGDSLGKIRGHAWHKIARCAGHATSRAADALPPLLAALGVDLEAVLAGTGIAAADFRPEAFVPFAACQTVLDRAAKLSGCDDLGLRLGRRQSLATLGPVGDVMRHAATLGEALNDFVTFQLGNSTGAAVYLLRSANDVVLGYGVYDSGGYVSPQLYDLVLAVGHTVIAELTEGAITADELWSIRTEPKDTKPYRGMAQRPILFGQSQTCLVYSAASMNYALPSANRAVRRELLAGLAARLSPKPWGMAARAKHALRSLMLQHKTTMPETARHLGVHPRTLRRALAAGRHDFRGNQARSTLRSRPGTAGRRRAAGSRHRRDAQFRHAKCVRPRFPQVERRNARHVAQAIAFTPLSCCDAQVCTRPSPRQNRLKA